MTMGELFSLSFYKDIPWVLAAGGSKGELVVWDTEENDKVKEHFTPFLDKGKVNKEIEMEEEQEEEVEDEEDSDSEEEKKQKEVK